ncbi:hypothetical protein EYC84_005857 [Monilinia fructicola]|uniref:Uncharacterized protein n=1 Tax=Monilinia fructicola TaxID=38448 RepID=A0A5M9JXW9_MONFR|nr:hypothetical protein EYC84_005857 [Monilinia fructicola]
MSSLRMLKIDGIEEFLANDDDELDEVEDEDVDVDEDEDEDSFSYAYAHAGEDVVIPIYENDWKIEIEAGAPLSDFIVDLAIGTIPLIEERVQVQVWWSRCMYGGYWIRIGSPKDLVGHLQTKHEVRPRRLSERLVGWLYRFRSNSRTLIILRISMRYSRKRKRYGMVWYGMVWSFFSCLWHCCDYPFGTDGMGQLISKSGQECGFKG